jgi:hypothetical protein
VPSASIDELTSRPSVGFMISATTTHVLKLSVTSPHLFSYGRSLVVAIHPMIVEAPGNRAPVVAHKPIGPCANTAAVSPILIFAFSELMPTQN